MGSRTGQKNTPEHNAKIAAAHRGRKLSPERIEKTRQANLGRKQSPEEIEKRRLANTGKKRSPEFCEQMRQLNLNMPSEKKAARSEKIRKNNLNRDPAEKERLRQGLISRNKARKGEKREFPPVREAGSADPVFYVYEHWRPDRGECFYVGKGYGQRAHDLTRGRNRWHKFITQKLSELGLVVEVRIIAENLTEREAFDAEVARIAFWKNDGADLCNISAGGDGPSGRKHTEEWKKAISEKLKGRKMSAESRAKLSAALKGNKNSLGYKRPPEEVERLAALNRGKKRTPEMNAHMSAVRKANPTFKGKHHTEELKAASSARQKGIPKPEWVKERMRKPKGEEHKRKLREINLGKTHTEETRKKLSEIAKADWARRKAERVAMNAELLLSDKE